MTLKFVVMSDLHLLPEGELSMTLDTAARLEQAIETVISRHADADSAFWPAISPILARGLPMND